MRKRAYELKMGKNRPMRYLQMGYLSRVIQTGKLRRLGKKGCMRNRAKAGGTAKRDGEMQMALSD